MHKVTAAIIDSVADKNTSRVEFDFAEVYENFRGNLTDDFMRQAFGELFMPQYRDDYVNTGKTDKLPAKTIKARIDSYRLRVRISIPSIEAMQGMSAKDAALKMVTEELSKDVNKLFIGVIAARLFIRDVNNDETLDMGLKVRGLIRQRQMINPS